MAKVVGKQLGVERGAHEDEAEVGALGEEVPENNEKEVWGEIWTTTGLRLVMSDMPSFVPDS